MPRQSLENLITHTREQLGFLQRSGELFDAGFRSEAKRIAVAVANLVYDSGQTTSLLSLTGHKECIPFMDSSNIPFPGNVMSEHRLCGMRIYPRGKGSGFYPFLDSPVSKVRWVPFDEWWSRIVVTDIRGNAFTRSDLVRNFRNRDGGAHINSRLGIPYHQLSRENSLGLQFSNNDFEGPAEYGAEYASVRQIGFEVYMSIGIGLGDRIGWETPDIEVASAPFKLSGMPNTEVDATGERATFTLAFENGELLSLSCATDALEFILNNLEQLARKALLRQLENGSQRDEPIQEIPSFHTHFSKLEIEPSTENSDYMILKLCRGGRPPITTVIAPELAGRIKKVFGNGDNVG